MHQNHDLTVSYYLVGDAGEDERELSSDVISLSAAAEDSESEFMQPFLV